MNKAALPASPPFTVGSVADFKTLDSLYWGNLNEQCDVLELRLDALTTGSDDADKLITLCERIAPHIPILITARCVNEGGVNRMSTEERADLLQTFAPYATYADVEIAWAAEFASTIDILKDNGIQIVLSYHHFKETPNEEVLHEKISQGLELGADVVKMAFFHNSVSDIPRCAELFSSHPETRLSIMGMGALAPVSRLLYAQHGSELNYGFLGGTPTAQGQWHANELKAGIAGLDQVPRTAE